MDKKETMQLKGIALMLLFWHHLFGCGSFLMLEENIWIPCFQKYDAVFGKGAKICIGLFAASSGYGLYKSYLANASYWGFLKRIGNFLITYWILLCCVAIPYLLYFQKFHPEWILVNLFALLHNDEMLYLSFSWYVKVYLEILLILPFIKFLNSKIHTLYMDFIIFILLPLSIGIYLPNAESNFINWKKNILSSIRLLFTWYPVFHVGVIYAKYKILERNCEGETEHLLNKRSLTNIVSNILIIAVMLQIVYYRSQGLFGYYTDVICTAMFVYLFDICYKMNKKTGISKVITFLGKYSFQYWLISGMFFLNTVEFQWVLVLPRYSIMIFVWKILLITPIAFFMSKVSERICKIMWNSKKNY